MTIQQALRSLTPYPIAAAFIEAVCSEHGLQPDGEYTGATAALPAFRPCKARVYQYLATAPNVAQGGVSYTFSPEERSYFKKLALELFGGEDESAAGGEYGYCGEDL